MSRKSYPKQFARITGDESLFQASARRLSGPSFAAPMIITGADFRFIVTEQLAAVETAPAAILIEPLARNTAPAICAAALALEARAPGALMLVAPSDHVIPDAKRFRAAVQAAAAETRAGNLVTFGIRPDRTETGYGWLELSHAPSEDFAPEPQLLKAFVEKPDGATAHAMLDGGQHLWNAGVFLFSTTAILAAFREFAPELLAGVENALAEAETDLGFTRLAPAPWQQLVGIGLENIIAVAMPDAVLVAHKDRAQDVKLAVQTLKAAGVAQAETLPRDYRPWGWYEGIALGPRFQVKRIVVYPGAALSLQSHHHRAEHWIVVEGTAKVTVDQKTHLVTENQSVFIPLGTVHRLENPGKLLLTLIEVQTGAYLGEDDIIRYDDVYARGQREKG